MVTSDALFPLITKKIQAKKWVRTFHVMCKCKYLLVPASYEISCEMWRPHYRINNKLFLLKTLSSQLSQVIHQLHCWPLCPSVFPACSKWRGSIAKIVSLSWWSYIHGTSHHFLFPGWGLIPWHLDQYLLTAVFHISTFTYYGLSLACAVHEWGSINSVSHLQYMVEEPSLVSVIYTIWLRRH